MHTREYASGGLPLPTVSFEFVPGVTDAREKQMVTSRSAAASTTVSFLQATCPRSVSLICLARL